MLITIMKLKFRNACTILWHSTPNDERDNLPSSGSKATQFLQIHQGNNQGGKQPCQQKKTLGTPSMIRGTTWHKSTALGISYET